MPESPYAGLLPFTEEQAPFFFGRDAEREIIIANLMAAKLTLLYGPSGVGKSSVLNAGVVYHLRHPAEGMQDHGAGRRQVVVPFRTWRDQPLSALERAIESAAGVKGRGATFAERLDACAAAIDGDLLLILDQFEEYFMYHPGEEGSGTFADELPRALNHRSRRVSFLLSMREDSIAKLDFFKGRVPNLFDNYLRVDRLNRDQAREAIVRPVEEYNRRYVTDGKGSEVEPALVDEVLEQVRTHRLLPETQGRGVLASAVDSSVETPHLQLVMTRLWEEERRVGSRVLRLATLAALGGANEIVRRHVDSALDALSGDEREAAARIFQYLVTPAGTKIALGVEDLSPNAGMPAPALRDLLVKLSSGDQRILTTVAPAPDQPPSRERYQIFHDVLAQKVLAWRTRYVAAAEQRAAEALAQEQRARAEREAHAAARLRRLLVVVVALLAVSIGAAWLAWRQTREADAQRRTAELQTTKANLEASRATQETELRKERDALLAASNARNESLQAEFLALQQTRAADRAQQEGNVAEAARLRREAVAATARAETASQKERAERAEAERARNAAEAERIRSEQLVVTIAQQTASENAAVEPPKGPPLPGATPPAPVPAPQPAPVPNSPPAPAPPVGNYRTPYRQGIEAKNRGRWAEAAKLFEAAASQNGVDTGESISITGAGYFEPYAPKYYLGMAVKTLGSCSRALDLWERSEADGAIQKTDLFKSLQQNRQECLKGR